MHKYIHTYIHTRTFIKRLLTKRIQSAIGKGKTGGKKARAKEKGNQLNTCFFTFVLDLDFVTMAKNMPFFSNFAYITP